MFTPPFRAVLFKCVGFTIALLVLLIVGVEWTFSHFVQWPDWIETTIEWLGGLALVVGSIFLIPPVTSLIAGLYLDDIAAEVERDELSRRSAGQGAADACRRSALALKFFFVVLLVNIVALFLLLDSRRQSDRLLYRQRLSARPRIFRARRHAAYAAGRGEEAAGRRTGSPCSCAG